MTGRHIAFCGGGSGGHLTPAIAVAREILRQDPSVRITFLTSGRAIDQRVIESSGLKDNSQVHVVRLSLIRMPERRWSVVADTWRLWQSCRSVKAYFSRHPPDVVFGTGGFAAVPGMVGATGHHIPLVIFEANVRSGRANRWFWSRAAAQIFVWGNTLPRSDEFADADRRVTVGMPLRPEFPNVAIPKTSVSEHTLLILGGSQGSQRLNELMSRALLPDSIPAGWNVVHQTGPVSPHCTTNDSRIRRVPFISDMSTALRDASLVVSRAGAISLAELAACGCPTLLVPLSGLADDHQRHNAVYFEKEGAAVLIDETAPDAALKMTESLQWLMTHPEDRNELSEAICRLHRPNGAADVARIVLALGPDT